MPTVFVNVNCQCEVVLTEHGAKLWNEYLAGVPSQNAVSVGAPLRVSLWELAHVFGPGMFNGQLPERMPFYQNRILIEGAT